MRAGFRFPECIGRHDVQAFRNYQEQLQPILAQYKAKVDKLNADYDAALDAAGDEYDAALEALSQQHARELTEANEG